MQNSEATQQFHKSGNRQASCGFGPWSASLIAATSMVGFASQALGYETSDPVLNLMLEKGMVTESEAAKVQAQVDARRSNPAAIFPDSKWKFNTGIKNMEVFGDLRVRYEDRQAVDPIGGRIDLQRERYAIRFGVRGEALDDVYYGFRLETSSNPRSSWVTMGTSASGTTYQGPFGKSQAGINVGQIYFGWKLEKWLDITAGKMPNPLYTTPMVWSSTINPEGIAEHLKYTVGELELFANFGQFLYQDMNPNSASGGLGFDGIFGQTTRNIFQVAWQGGLLYHFTTNTTAKIGATFYQYFGQEASTYNVQLSPYYGDTYVGEGAYTGPGSENPVNGFSGYGNNGSITSSGPSTGFPNNQVGLNNLEVLEIPFEINFKISKKLDARIFGDFAYNFQGRQRAQAAAAAYAAYLGNPISVSGNSPTPSTITAFSPQSDECKAYQIGLALGSEGSLGLVNGTAAKKHAWEVRTYWQHTEQYALDPNLLDLDVFNVVENIEGIFAAAAFGFTDNLIGTIRYGYAARINNKLGTGGSSGDIPQINPVSQYNLFQVDLTLKF